MLCINISAAYCARNVDTHTPHWENKEDEKLSATHRDSLHAPASVRCCFHVPERKRETEHNFAQVHAQMQQMHTHKHTRTPIDSTANATICTKLDRSILFAAQRRVRKSLSPLLLFPRAVRCKRVRQQRDISY